MYHVWIWKAPYPHWLIEFEWSHKNSFFGSFGKDEYAEPSIGKALMIPSWWIRATCNCGNPRMKW